MTTQKCDTKSSLDLYTSNVTDAIGVVYQQAPPAESLFPSYYFFSTIEQPREMLVDKRAASIAYVLCFSSFHRIAPVVLLFKGLVRHFSWFWRSFQCTTNYRHRPHTLSLFHSRKKWKETYHARYRMLFDNVVHTFNFPCALYSRAFL